MKNILVLDSVLHITVTLTEFYQGKAVVESFQYEDFPILHTSALKTWLNRAGSFFKTEEQPPKGKEYDVMFLSATVVATGKIDIKDLLFQYGSGETRIVLMSNEATFPRLGIDNEVVMLNKESINVFTKLTSETKDILNNLIR